MADPVLKAVGLSKTYPSGDKTLGVLAGVDLAVAAGESISIRGESGSGKSTLLNLLAGLDRPDAGELFWNGDRARARSGCALPAGRYHGRLHEAHAERSGAVAILPVQPSAVLPRSRLHGGDCGLHDCDLDAGGTVAGMARGETQTRGGAA